MLEKKKLEIKVLVRKMEERAKKLFRISRHKYRI
jgi:hypothetical protein